jgi:hypothetical protein
VRDFGKKLCHTHFLSSILVSPLCPSTCYLSFALLLTIREAMGIVRSKVFGGANPYGTGRGIIDVGKGAYR